MNTLPASIEESLKDAGFSQTEILIMRRLIEDRSLSLRQLAAKTGKSTGVLDQAMKKLLAKKIVTKDNVNDNPVYTLASLESITRAIEEDTEDKKEMLKRRFENFEAFVGSLKLEKGRPVIESFEGADGLKRVYCKMLETGRELLVYQPAHGEEEDPDMADFRVEYFRERRRRNVFSRVISHNTPQGRRFQSRDAFEFRKTLLVDLEECPFNFEKLIMGSAVACINHAEKRACIIHYEELAQTERTLFETMWNKKSNPSAQPAAAGQAAASHPTIPLKTRTASQLRNFFLGPRSLFTMAFLVFFSALITRALYLQNASMNKAQIAQKVVSIAITGAIQFSATDIQALQKKDDWKKPEWNKVVKQLEKIRLENNGVVYAYIIRRTNKDNNFYTFVADSHSINPFANLDSKTDNDIDANGDGLIEPDGADLLQWPGQEYPNVPNHLSKAFEAPFATDFYEDQWGKVITGYSPIKNETGEHIAALAIDVKFQDFSNLNKKTFTSLIIFIGTFLLFLFLRVVFSRY